MKSAREKFEAVPPTFDSLKINKRTSLLMGGAGLTAYGINTHRGVNSAILREGEYVYQPFDIDALLPEGDFEDLKQRAAGIEGARIGGARIDIPPQEATLLPFSAVLFDRRTQEALLAEMQPEVVNEIAVMPAHEIAKLKNERNEPRDTIGLVLGHRDAYHEGLPTAEDTRWLKEIQTALRRARSLNKMPRAEVRQIAIDFAFPAEFTDALKDNFQDEAFRDIPT